ncbi:uncharacterized protein K452DRAFT_224180, partial [Aplosporella prunicola CBS 121167]
ADSRFANIHTDPRFRLPSKKNTRVTLDKRFAHMLKDDDFSKKATVDRYGRKVAKDAGKKELQRFYRVEDEDEEKDKEEDGEGSDEADDDDEIQKELAKADRKYDPAREGGFSSSEDESDSDEEESEIEVEEDEIEFPQGQDADVPMGEVSARLAAVNLDWDNIRAEDLLAVASSFAPEGGRIMNVTVYPSEFGRERMEREELEGPPREIFKKKARASSPGTSDEDEEDEEIKKDLLQEDKGEEFDSKALRQYQLERLRYYYALITTDSPNTAQHLYENMDGREYLSSANFFDLRFVPDSVSFDGDKPRDQCTRLPDGYRPNDFVTDALTHSRVKLTWDADDTTRKEVQKRAFSQKEIDDNDMQAYIGSDSSSDEDEPEEEVVDASSSGKKKAKEDKAAKLRAALGLSAELSSATKKSKDDRPVGDMQITFTSGLNSKANGSVFENEPVIEETTKEKYVRKEKERKQRRKEKMRAARGGTTKRAAKEARKAEKARKREAREAQAAADAAERAQLELLMADETGAPAGLRHFDMAEIEKAEKAAKRKGKGRGKKKHQKGDEGEEPRQAGFEMDTTDPRFAALFESHEFAIDPTNSKFKGTAGMKALLEEGRKKRKAQRDDGVEEVRRPKKSKAVDGGAAAGGGEDIKKLVERVKGKTKKVKA